MFLRVESFARHQLPSIDQNPEFASSLTKNEFTTIRRLGSGQHPFRRPRDRFPLSRFGIVHALLNADERGEVFRYGLDQSHVVRIVLFDQRQVDFLGPLRILLGSRWLPITSLRHPSNEVDFLSPPTNPVCLDIVLNLLRLAARFAIT
jgi:hypothetical protein